MSILIKVGDFQLKSQKELKLLRKLCYVKI